MAALAQVAYPKYVVFMAENAYSSLIWDDKEIILPMFFYQQGQKRTDSYRGQRYKTYFNYTIVI